MSTQESFEHSDAQPPKRYALFLGIFTAGLVGGAVFTSSLAHPHPPQASMAAVQVGAVTRVDIGRAATDPSVPDAATALSHRRHDRADTIAPTF